MLIPAPYLGYVAKTVTQRLAADGFCSFQQPDSAAERLEKVLVEDFATEDAINTEARELLKQYGDYMRKNDIPFFDMFQKVKRNLLEERKYISAAAKDSPTKKMKVARDKVTDLSHQLAKMLPRISGARVLKSWNDSRLEIQRILTELFQKEEAVAKFARQKIESQSRTIDEGTEEWRVLQRRYYEEEMKRFGVDMSPREDRQV